MNITAEQSKSLIIKSPGFLSTRLFDDYKILYQPIQIFLSADCFSFACLSEANEKKSSLCDLCAFAVKKYG